MMKSKKKIPLRAMVVCAMLTAVAVVLDRFVPVVFTDSLKVTLTFIPVLVAAILFPRGVYFPGFTVTAALKGALFGWFLSREGAKFFPHAVIPTAVNNFVIGLLVDTVWIALLYSSKTYLEKVWEDTDIRPVWLAQYIDKADYKGSYILWQASSTGKIDGIGTDVDMNVLYHY